MFNDEPRAREILSRAARERRDTERENNPFLAEQRRIARKRQDAIDDIVGNWHIIAIFSLLFPLIIILVILVAIALGQAFLAFLGVYLISLTIITAIIYIRKLMD